MSLLSSIERDQPLGRGVWPLFSDVPFIAGGLVRFTDRKFDFRSFPPIIPYEGCEGRGGWQGTRGQERVSGRGRSPAPALLYGQLGGGFEEIDAPSPCRYVPVILRRSLRTRRNRRRLAPVAHREHRPARGRNPRRVAAAEALRAATGRSAAESSRSRRLVVAQ